VTIRCDSLACFVVQHALRRGAASFSYLAEQGTEVEAFTLLVTFSNRGWEHARSGSVESREFLP